MRLVDQVPIGLLFVVMCGLAGLALESGYRLGRWRHRRIADEKESPVGAMVASLLALFAFLLAFTFGMAASRFEARRQTVLEEANAIGTTYLRTQLLPEPQRTASARLLREYVDARVKGVQELRMEEAVQRSQAIHTQLWTQAVQSAEKQPGPITALYIQSLNETIDVHAVRVQTGLQSRIPIIIWFGLFTLAFLSMASVGYLSGLSETRRSPAMMVLVVAFAVVLILIVDLDRPLDGFVRVSQAAMIELQASMKDGN